ncbi:MAG: cobaltochelatase subunit CobN [Deltaproteobacteria bacterium]|jgi:cobaltochelatase CobN|nr:cobaltochelatase subunit CobN [Deltaproteobacteria bacterium]
MPSDPYQAARRKTPPAADRGAASAWLAARAALAAALALASAAPALATDVSMIVSDSDSWMVHEALDGTALADGVTLKVFCMADLLDGDEAAGFVEGSEAVLVDIMDDKHTAWVRERGLTGRSGTTLYALRESADDEKLRREGYVFDPEVRGYYYYLSGPNVVNAVRRILSLKLVPGLEYGPVEEILGIGVYHPDAAETFADADEFMEWYGGRPGFDPSRPWVALMFFEAYLLQGQKPALANLVRIMEDEGLNVMPAFGSDLPLIETLLLDKGRRSRVDAVASFNLKFYLAYTEGLKEAIADLDVPIVNLVNLYTQTTDEWRESPAGIRPLDVIWNLDNPETSGVIEPNMVMGKAEARNAQGARIYRWDVMEDGARHMARRVLRHVELARKPNAEKRVAVLYYNNSRGKHAIGAAYLNVFRSLADVLDRLAAEGYAADSDPPLDEGQVKDLVLRGGRNVGAWAPGELDAMIEGGTVVLWPISEYRALFECLPEEYRTKVLEQWGTPEEGDVMTRDGKLVLPVIVRGNVAIMPQPARAIEDDPMKLYHDPLIYPHHQYLALYLWLEHVWRADAVVHFGTHGTLEWMPGKQSGMSLSDPPEVLMGTLPDVYPYNMDVVAEGIQAKRRGRAILVDHLIPPLVTAGPYREYETLARLAESYLRAESMDSDTQADYLAQIRELSAALALEKDLHLDAIDGPDAVRALSVYLEYMAKEDVPYGLHTFGTSPAGDGRDALLDMMARENPGLDKAESGRKMDASGENEFAGLLDGLSGSWVESGEGNDPVRNPEALPTGRNFYGLSPGRLPTREAWRLGQEAADRIISDYIGEHGEYPDKVAVVIWAVEAMRNEGVNESTVLALVGAEPQWAPSGLVTGTRPIPGRELGRPRIDVTIDSSGLYRDLFPDRLLFLDNAIRQAALQDDVENFISRNDEANRRALLAKGFSEEEAGRFSRARIFSERVGNYGNRVPETISSSGSWDDPNDVALAFREHTGYAYGTDFWGEPARDALELNLAGSKIAWHSRSSNLFGILDDDDFNGYLGGLAMAITSLSDGAAPETLVTDQRSPGKVAMTSLDTMIGTETRTRYLNPTWIRGMKAEGYAGALEMAKFVEYLFGFNVTVPQDVDPRLWDQTYEVYVEDNYGEDLPGFMDRENPWAFQSLTGRMLETVRKGFWDPSDEVRQKLAVDYAMSVIERGVACCDHTCNNPQLNQMVVNIVSLPGVMAPELIAEFKLAIEQMAQKSLEEQVADNQRMIQDLGDRRAELDSNPPRPEARPQERPEDRPGPEARDEEAQDAESVRGLKMENVSEPAEDTSMSSSGVEWTLSIFVLALLAIFFIGYRRKAKRAVRPGGADGNGDGDRNGPRGAGGPATTDSPGAGRGVAPEKGGTPDSGK